LEEVKWARAKAWCIAALSVVAIDACRFRYEQLELRSSIDGGGTTDGGGTQAVGGASNALGGAAELVDGGAASADEAGAGGAVDVGGTSGNAGGAGAGGTNSGGTNSGGTNSGGTNSGGTSGGPGVCVPDATCSCDVFQGHDYRFCTVLAIFDEAAAACQSANMSMIRVDSAEENDWLLQQFIAQGMFKGGGAPIVFLGGSDLQTSGQWVWQDGTLFWDGAAIGGVYSNFAFAPKAGKGDCLGMTSDGNWSGRACNSGNATVACEAP
jgi:hypothetical protein